MLYIIHIYLHVSSILPNICLFRMEWTQWNICYSWISCQQTRSCTSPSRISASSLSVSAARYWTLRSWRERKRTTRFTTGQSRQPSVARLCGSWVSSTTPTTTPLVNTRSTYLTPHLLRKMERKANNNKIVLLAFGLKLAGVAVV